MTAVDRIRAAQENAGSTLCVGLDPDPERLPSWPGAPGPLADRIVAFNEAIIRSTAASACAYKLNFAFYEALGPRGYETIQRTIDAIPDTHLVIADAKRGDIGNSARFYAGAIFDDLGCDAITVSPYMGADSVRPFLAYGDRLTFVLGRTSNAGAADFQELSCEGSPLYGHVAEAAERWNADLPGSCGLVVGATSADALRGVREHAPNLPFLVPGVGAQGGDPAVVMETAHRPDAPVLVNSSRSIIYASEAKDFAESAAEAAQKLAAKLTIA